MSEIKDAGTAFPCDEQIRDSMIYQSEPGLSIRDYFAAKAMAACVSQCNGDTRMPGETQAELIARRSYELADAMLRARQS